VESIAKYLQSGMLVVLESTTYPGTTEELVQPLLEQGGLKAVAEMVKLLANTFRAVNIGTVNELAMMCEKLGIDVWEVINAAKTKPFGFMPFYPGPGLGGHCIPIARPTCHGPQNRPGSNHGSLSSLDRSTAPCLTWSSTRSPKR